MEIEKISSNREPALLTQGVLCSLASLEGADNQLLGASLFVTEKELNFGFTSLRNMSWAQGLMANAASPFWGVFADRGILKQRDLLVIAATGQGLITILLAFQQSYGAFMVILRGLNGLFLAGLRPIANGVVAKNTSEDLQGKIFSRILVFILLGGSLVGLTVTPTADAKVSMFGNEVSGWRISWTLVGALSVMVAVFTQFGMPAEVLPPRGEEKIVPMVFNEVKLLFGFCGIPTFICMVAQGVFGTIPWTVLWLGTRYYQLGNLSNVQAGVLSAWSPFAAMPGTLLGGFLADMAARKYGGEHGRPLVAQATVLLGVPIMYLNFFGIAPENGSFAAYFTLNTLFGVCAQWAQGGTNWPILSQIVPAETRSRVLAMEGALENSLATILGPGFVTVITTQILGFDLGDVQGEDTDYESARALGTALALTVCVPWLVAFIIYSVLHYTVPRDFQKLRDGMADHSNENMNPSKSRASVSSYLLTKSHSKMGGM